MDAGWYICVFIPRDTPLPHPSLFFLSFCKEDFLAMSVSLFGGGLLGLLDLDLPQILCVQ